MKFRAMASSVFGVEAVLSGELRGLGFENVSNRDGRVFFDSDETGIAVANICLRTAERVYIVLGEFEVQDSESLYQAVKSLGWERYLEKDSAFPVDVNLVKTPQQLSSNSVTQKTVKKGIVDRLRHVYRTEFFSESGSKYHVYINIIQNRAIALLDTSGSGLHRRGYREYAGAAPLRETLAAALVQLSGWRTNTALIDTFCGSGTILIEAALYALGIPPNRDRRFPFEEWRYFREVDMNSIRFRKMRQAEETLSIEGYDIDASSIRQARINASKAGVESFIHFQVRDMRALRSSHRKGTLISNLPYGERLLDRQKASELYRTLGQLIRGESEFSSRTGFRNWYKFFYTSHDDFEHYFGAKADKNRKLYNSGLKSYLYMYYPEDRAKKY